LPFWQVAEKRSGMLRAPHHERKNINDINSSPFVLSAVEALLRVFQQPAKVCMP
jgi:hypothetical protein